MKDIFRTENLMELRQFPESDKLLGIHERTPLHKSDDFFRQLTKTSFDVFGEVRANQAEDDIQEILRDILSESLRLKPFYQTWIQDMAEICRCFCLIQGDDTIAFWLGTKRGCRRYHVDNVDLRLLVTYSGQGTEWLPENAGDRQAFEEGASNEKIVKNSDDIQYINKWDVAIFRGGPKGLLHRTPDSALSSPSLLMRLDHVSFWKTVQQMNQEALNNAA